MTLPEAVVLLNREIEKSAIAEDFITLQKLDFIKKQITQHTCQKKRKRK